MIELQLKAIFDQSSDPFVVKFGRSSRNDDDASDFASADLLEPGLYACRSSYGTFKIRTAPDDPIDGDVLLCLPHRNVAQRIFRRASRQNTLLMTERCDQLCVMCSQPPKKSNDNWLFPHYERALKLVDADATIGISGGEPTLYKDTLLGMLERVSKSRPDIAYHILSNGQHFVADDRARLSGLHENIDVTWGIPLYSHNGPTHDKIVGKDGAYNRVMEALFILASTKAKIELRTVITAMNVMELPQLASFVASHLPFISDWAIMGMEPIGYAKANREALFFDHSAFSQPLVNAAAISQLRGLPCHFYNIPRCTVPSRIRDLCVDSISDWKKKFLSQCDNCDERSSCSGFFEWYNQKWEWSGVKPIIRGGIQT